MRDTRVVWNLLRALAQNTWSRRSSPGAGTVEGDEGSMFPISSRAGGTFVSRAALAAALALGLAGGMVATAAPAIAKDAKAEGPKLSKGFIALAGPLQNDMAKAKDQASAAALKDKVLAAIAAAQTVDDKFFAGNFAVQIGQTSKDNALMKTGLETVIGSGKLSGPELGKYNYYLGGMAFDAKDYAGARAAFGNAVAAGYTENDVQALLAETYFATNELPKGLEVLGAAIAARKTAGSTPPKEWYIRGLSVAYKAKTYEQAFGFGAGLVEAYPSTDNWADAIGLARTAAFDPWTGLGSLRTGRISQARCVQRAGRAGRTAPGFCVRLWTQDDHFARAAQELPEVKRLDLAEIVETRNAQPWRANAACRNRPTYLWFPAKGDHYTADKAMQICRACIVRDECRAANIDQPAGIFAGLSAKARKEIRTERSTAVEIRSFPFDDLERYLLARHGDDGTAGLGTADGRALSDTRIGVLVGIDRATVNRWRAAGSVPAQSARRICTHLDVPYAAIWRAREEVAA